MKKALVVGNGESRKRIGLNLFKRNEWEIYGCNALYREFNPDHLVIIDKEMRTEFEYNSHQAGRAVDEPEGNTFYGMPKHVYFVEDMPEYEPMMNSGHMAICIAMRDHKEIDIIGFDLETTDGLTNNVYKDSPQYKPSNKEAGGFIIDAYNLKMISNRFREKGGIITRVADSIPFELDKYMKHVKIEEYISEVFTNNFHTHIRERNAT
jgi:hypothetical protein